MILPESYPPGNSRRWPSQASNLSSSLLSKQENCWFSNSTLKVEPYRSILRLAPCKVHSRRSLDFVGVETVDRSQVVGHIQAHHIYLTSTSHYTTIHFSIFFLSDRKKGNIVIYDSERLRGYHVNHATSGGRFK